MRASSPALLLILACATGASAAPERSPGPEEPARKEVLEAARATGAVCREALPKAEALLKKAEAAEREGKEDHEYEAFLLEIQTRLRQQLAVFTKHQEALQGELAADTLLALFEGLFPEERAMTPDQRSGFRKLYLDQDQRLAGLAVPRGEIFFGMFSFAWLGQEGPPAAAGEAATPPFKDPDKSRREALRQARLALTRGMEQLIPKQVAYARTLGVFLGWAEKAKEAPPMIELIPEP